MIAAAQGVNARLREVYPDGYSLDESHAPHITLLQRYVREQDLEKVTAAVAQVLQETDPLTLKMRSSGYHVRGLGRGRPDRDCRRAVSRPGATA